MSELRQDQATKRWVIMATDRAKRPSDLAAPKQPETAPSADTSKCPFCPGNEAKTPPELLAYRPEGGESNSPGWQVRVVPNRFAALRPEGEVTVQNRHWLTTVAGYGYHEVIIESPDHNANPATMTVEELGRVLMAGGERFAKLQEDRRLSYIAFFRNHGLAAGSSLRHPHTQIIATPVAPTDVRHEIEEARRHYDDRLHCAYCETIELEAEAGTRVVFETDDYFVFEPFASRWPAETWVVPKKHDPSFLPGSEDLEIASLADTLLVTLRALYEAFGDPAYNLVLHEAPLRDSCEDYYHWHIEILPRLSTAAGFELGTGIWINTLMPEDAAAYLRDHLKA